MIDADQWEQLITSSLPYLKKFKFIFTSHIGIDNEIIINKFKRFQSDFWQKQHHWYTEYILGKCSAFIYTIPYVSHKYELKSDTAPYSNQLVNSSHAFYHVTDLILPYKHITENCSYYFSNVKSLIIKDSCSNYDITNSRIGKEHVDSLGRIINLSNLRHFGTASPYKIETGLVLLELLSHTPHLLSLTIHPDQLILFHQLPKLLNIKVYAIAMINPDNFFSRFKDIATQKNINFQTDHKWSWSQCLSSKYIYLEWLID